MRIALKSPEADHNSRAYDILAVAIALLAVGTVWLMLS